MACFHPMTGYRSRILSPNGKRKIVFALSEGFRDLPVTISCGQCSGCRLERSRQWAIRALHESQMHERNCFITLTYAPEYLPAFGNLDYDAPVLFMKRLRRRFGSGIRSYGCAEYGAEFGRPHYHICVFGHDFDDKEILRNLPSGFPLYSSKELEKLWSFGYSSLGAFSFETAAYVARYVMKKVTGDLAEHYYQHVSPTTGEVVALNPEKPVCVSRRPGLGKPWFDLYTSDVYPDDFVLVNGKKCRPPRYYDYRFEIDFPEDYLKVKTLRKISASDYLENNTPERLTVREEILDRKIELLKRSYENES